MPQDIVSASVTVYLEVSCATNGPAEIRLLSGYYGSIDRLHVSRPDIVGTSEMYKDSLMGWIFANVDDSECRLGGGNWAREVCPQMAVRDARCARSPRCSFDTRTDSNWMLDF